MTAADIAPEIATLRRKVCEMSAAADEKLRVIEHLIVAVDGLRHDQQSLRAALRAILDHLDQLVPLGNASTAQE